MLIYTHPNSLIVENAKALLESEGIAVTVKNNFLASGAGELAPTDTWPEVWLLREKDEAAAREILSLLDKESDKPDWKCENCGEVNYASFNLCWNCQHKRPRA